MGNALTERCALADDPTQRICPDCLEGQTCSFTGAGEGTCVPIPKECAICNPKHGQHCVVSDDGNPFCVCADGFHPNPNLDSNIPCIREGFCSPTLRCDRDFEVCLHRLNENGEPFAFCDCQHGYIRNRLLGKCEPGGSGSNNTDRGLTGCIPCLGDNPGADCGCGSRDLGLVCIVRDRENHLFGICRCDADRGFIYDPDTKQCVCRRPLVLQDDRCVEEGTPPPVDHTYVCVASGDPHFITFDSYYWHFQTFGKHIFTNSPKNSFQIQLLQGECGPSITTVACALAVAFKTTNHKVEIGTTGDRDVYVDGSAVTLPQTVDG